MLYNTRSRIKTPGKSKNEVPDTFPRHLGHPGRNASHRHGQCRQRAEHQHLRRRSPDPGRRRRQHGVRTHARPAEEKQGRKTRRLRQESGQEPCEGLQVRRQEEPKGAWPLRSPTTSQERRPSRATLFHFIFLDTIYTDLEKAISPWAQSRANG